MNEHIDIASCDITLTPFDNKRLLSLCGRFDEHLRQIERRLHVEILNRGNAFQLAGTPQAISDAETILKKLYQQTGQGKELSPSQVHLSIQQHASTKATSKGANVNSSDENATDSEDNETLQLRTPMGAITPRTPNQVNFVQNILKHDINFGIGPAGTGKTFLAVACAVTALEQRQIRRIILVRPIVEAGERLGFLPGDISQKIDPYLRPLYDALFEMLGEEKVTKLLEQQVIEIAPLAYMRGRTLNDAFIILDESQNTTIEQMKMFLTRIGFSSTAVITGDVTQIDLPRGRTSGLKHALDILGNLSTISFSRFYTKDVVRHPVVQEIIDAYAKSEKQQRAPE